MNLTVDQPRTSLRAAPSRHCARCQLPGLSAHAHDPSEGTLVDGRYEVERVLGQGGGGLVLLALDVHLRRKVALKLMSVATEDAVTTPERFVDEAAALASVRHEHVAAVFGLGVHRGRAFIAMEYVDGSSVAHALRLHRHHGGHLSVQRAISILEGVAAGLSQVHAQGIVHRDVKPANVIVETGTGRPVLVDFGLATSFLGEVDELVAGTPEYMAPEALVGARLDPRADQYSLGCMAYEMLTGRPPFVASHPHEVAQAHLTSPVLLPSALRPELFALDEVLLKALSKYPAERFANCQVFSDALTDAARRVVRDRPQPIASIWPSAPGSASDTSPQGLRVLVVDDEPVFAELAEQAASEALAGQQLEIVRAATGDDGLAALMRGRLPRLIVLDYQMPGLDGVELLSRMRAMPGGRDVEAIVVSGSVGESERWRFSLLGVRHFVQKPVDQAALVSAIAEAGQARGWFFSEQPVQTRAIK